jgi:predicted N-acetyltransferase YhbS
MEAAIIRTAEPKDAADIEALATDFAVSFSVESEAFHRVFAELLTTPHTLLAVAEVDGQMVGYVLGFAHAAFYANGYVAWVEEIAVRSDFRGQGIGRLLMQRMEEWAEQRECKLVALATRRASAFYARLGYTPSAEYFRKLL